MAFPMIKNNKPAKNNNLPYQFSKNKRIKK